ncbi:MAG: PP2C family protein-serine/threonine phosphatase [Bacteroidota bacterium]
MTSKLKLIKHIAKDEIKLRPIDDYVHLHQKYHQLLKDYNHLKNEYQDQKVLYNNLIEHSTFIENELDEKLKIIENANKKINQSITYAKRIQYAVFPQKSELYNLLPHSFILHRSRDVVSGDFYWFKKVDHRIFIAAADCTGHGIPGAFMSMLGIAFLNEVTQHTERPADQILEDLRDRMKSSLHQQGDPKETKDGMDLAFCAIDMQKNILEFSGAYRPLYHFRDNQLNEYKGNRVPIGISIKERPFIKHEIKLQPGDTFYIFSDGYIDQITPNRKKYKSRRFKNFLQDIHTFDLPKQKALLEEELDNWQKNEEQVDDILVMGFRINNLSE